ncbi:MFS transporter [Serratia marcescens]|uniref:MFS transporter n=1 Tax=Serratia marcescens TaxID=615 RepID=UPI00040904E6|nr:MFS transporter [Serratia marcescens]MDM3536767.1 MFS transporter [Serratia marcescens]HEJ6931013.1 MFS transporter [Serratia marcescens]HEJ7075875.1 MFS transporter [Serratia marcescens]HEJ7199212.1 MFS transporter [Serratia marcescens]HEJ9033286.1 MFS transporter [Serratia marcescens]
MTILQCTNASVKAGLIRYACAAMLARVADGGGVLAVILLCQSSEQYYAVTGGMAACITFPHMLGPFIARRIDTASDGRRVIATACLAYAVIIGIMIATFGHVPLLLTALLLIAAGLCGPLLTSGISTFLPAIAGPDQRSQRRAQGLDVATYGFGGTLGPSAVAAITTWASPSAAFYLLAVGTVFAAFFIMRLPVSPVTHSGKPAEVAGAIATVGMMIRHTPLRRTLYLTMAVAFAVAALPVVAVSMADVLGVPAATAALLTVAYGAGNLAGSVFLMVIPLRGEPDRLMLGTGGLIVAGLLSILEVSSFLPVFFCFFITGMLNAAFFAATLAARSEYSPPSCRGQVFVWVGAMKITAGSLGTAAAGQVMTVGAYAALMLSLCTLSAILVISLLACIWPSSKSHR